MREFERELDKFHIHHHPHIHPPHPHVHHPHNPFDDDDSGDNLLSYLVMGIINLFS